MGAGAAAPCGAHPGALSAAPLPVRSLGADGGFWSAARGAARSDLDSWARRWVLEPQSQAEYLDRLGTARLEWLLSRSDPESWRADAEAHPVDPVDDRTPPSAWERAAAYCARELLSTVADSGADAVLAGAGVANLAAWAAVEQAKAKGIRVQLTAELGLWGYTPTHADPYIFNQRVFPATPMLADASTVLGMVVGGPGTRTVACLGAAQVDRRGNLNSTLVPGGPFLVGSGGANDVASRADACVVVSLARPERLVEEVGFVTSPGRRISAVVTDLGVLRRRDGELRVCAVPAGAEDLKARVQALSQSCGFEVGVSRDLEEMAPLSESEVIALRRYDPQRLFLS